MAIDYFSDPKTGKLMKAEDFLKREKKEWGQALGTLFKECVGHGKSGGEQMLITTDKELRKMMGSAHNFKK